MAFIDNTIGIMYQNEFHTALNHRYLINNIMNKTGILQGVYDEISFTNVGLTFTINRGICLFQGGTVENGTSEIDLTLAAGANEFGYVYIQADLNQTANNQISLGSKQQVGSLPTLTQQSFKDNPTNAIYEFPIFSFEVSNVGIVSTTDERIILNDGFDKNDIGLENVENYPVATQAEAEAGTANDRYMTPLRTSQLLVAQGLFEYGTYTGNNAATRDIVLGFEPTAVEIWTKSGVQGSEADEQTWGGFMTQTLDLFNSRALGANLVAANIIPTGFTVRNDLVNDINVNNGSTTYYYRVTR